MDQDIRDILDRASRKSMEWGVDDCGYFACGLAMAQCGTDPRCEAIKGTYRTQLGLYRIFRRLGHTTLLGYATERFSAIGWPVVEASDPTALIGFIHMLHGGKDRAAMCARVAPGWFAARAQDGLVIVPASSVREAWACPGP